MPSSPWWDYPTAASEGNPTSPVTTSGSFFEQLFAALEGVTKTSREQLEIAAIYRIAPPVSDSERPHQRVRQFREQLVLFPWRGTAAPGKTRTDREKNQWRRWKATTLMANKREGKRTAPHVIRDLETYREAHGIPPGGLRESYDAWQALADLGEALGLDLRDKRTCERKVAGWAATLESLIPLMKIPVL